MLYRFAFVAIALAVSPALAQQKPATAVAQQRPAAPAPGLTQPENTTATFGDWIHRCQQSATARICEIAQAIQIQGQNAPVALVAIGRPVKTEPTKIVIQVAPNLAFGAGLRVTLGDKDEGVPATWQRCIPGGCFAEAVMTDDLMKRWRAQTENGQLRYTDAANRPIALPFSLRGFTAAADALSRDL